MHRSRGREMALLGLSVKYSVVMEMRTGYKRIILVHLSLGVPWFAACRWKMVRDRGDPGQSEATVSGN